MSNHLFLYHGGTYKRGEDDGRIRVPQSRREADLIIHDSELPGDTDNSVGGELHMSRWADIFNNVEVGDYIYTQVIPDATGIRGIFAVPQNVVAGFSVEFDFVSLVDVWNAYNCGKSFDDLESFGPTSSPLLFDNAIGMSPDQAAVQADLECEPYSDFRGMAPGLQEYFDEPFMLKVGQAIYVRMKILTLPTDAIGSACGGCGSTGNSWPKLHYGVIIDKLCLSKVEWSDHCRCKTPICAGCTPTTDCNECDEEEELEP